jgi:hypothetical protein
MVRHRRAWAPVLTRRQRLAGHLGGGVEEAGGQGPDAVGPRDSLLLQPPRPKRPARSALIRESPTSHPAGISRRQPGSSGAG